MFGFGNGNSGDDERGLIEQRRKDLGRRAKDLTKASKAEKDRRKAGRLLDAGFACAVEAEELYRQLKRG